MSYGGPSKTHYDKVVLCYSGGLDTSCILKWLQAEYGAEVVTFTADLGQTFADPTHFEVIEEKARNLGALAHYTIDLKEIFIKDYIFPAIKANALYQGVYPLATALGRPLIAIEAVKIAKEVGADAIAHGCTGKGNDQVRFNVTIRAYAPEIEVLQPVVEWGMGRDDELKYAEERGIPIAKANKKYSTDENLYGRSAECDILEHPEEIPPEDAKEWTVSPENAPDEAEIIKIGFEQGIPVAINDEQLAPVDLFFKLHEVGCKHGVGRLEHMEDRAVGLKSRETYEAPVGAILVPAHYELEKYVCTKHENAFKRYVDQRWTELAYEGLWVDPLMDALNAFVDEVNKKVTGWVKVRLFKGSAQVVARESAYGLYNLNLATYDTASTFNQKASYGFMELHGLASRMGFQIKQRLKEDLK
ncbi:MAG TPA: argininosuccinate synthase [Candidatus Lokiarchaeia archaeon]|nr:argininosuccinate synthase [Candidatus Lokiarchaeia archaeon]